MKKNQVSCYNINRPHGLNVSGLVFLGLFFLYFIGSPFYFFDSGLPQPADFILALGIISFFAYSSLRSKFSISQVYLAGMLFAVYAFLINLVHLYYYPDIRFFLTSLIYVFNISIFIFVSYLLKRHPSTSLNIIIWGILITTFIQTLHVLYVPSEHNFRAIGTFNNPNQLAYWALLTASILIVIKNNLRFTIFDYAALSALYYIQMLSLSKAGIITLTLIYLITFSTKIIKFKNSALIAAILLLSVIGTLSIFQFSDFVEKINNIQALEKTTSRILSIGEEGDDSLEGRGYTRLTENPIYLVLGAGEGAFWRYAAGGYDQELHSGLATLFFSYGVIGVLVFSVFIFKILKNRPIFLISIFLIVMMYGFTHQNLRFSLYWVFLALIYIVPIQRLENSNKKTKLL